MTKTDWHDALIGMGGLVAALAALYFSLRPGQAVQPASVSNTIIEPDNSTEGFTGSVGSGIPHNQTLGVQDMASNQYGAGPRFPGTTLAPAGSGNIIFPPLQDEGLSVPAMAPINNNINIGTCCGG